MKVTRGVLTLALGALAGCGSYGTGARPPAPSQATAAEYLYLWSASVDTTQPDFLAVVDATEGAPTYGALVTTLPVPGRRNLPHHTEHELAPDRMLFANGFATGQTYVFDLNDPARPRLASQFGDLEGFTHPHSYLRLPNGNVLATYQSRHAGGRILPGGLVEVTPAGRPVRARSADGPGIDTGTRVYSAGVVESLDRIVTTTTDMHADFDASRQLQIWRLSDMTLLHTIVLPDGPAGDESRLTAEPRVLADGRTVLVSTFSCGLYLMEGLETDAPSARLVASFPRKEKTYCAIPVVTGNWYLVTVPALNAVVALDISDPSAPREAGRLTLGEGDVPHWISLSPDGRRVVLTGYGDMQHQVVMARFDAETGRLTHDDRFTFRMDDKSWPHGGTAKAMPHGAVFSRATPPPPAR